MNRNVFAATFIAIIAASPGLAHADLVTNGGFEDDVIDASGDPVTPPSGWTVVGGPAANIGVDNSNPNSGQNEAFLGTIGTTGALQQTLTTVAGTTYDISFAVENQTPGSTSDSFVMSFGSDTLLTLDGTSLLPGGYVVYNFTDVAAGPSTLLAFTERNDEGNWYLDDVSVNAESTAVPEPSPMAMFATMLAAFGLMLGLRRRS